MRTATSDSLWATLGVLCGAVLIGCSGAAPPSVDSRRAASTSSSGYVTQGRTLQGRTLQGRTLQGRTLQGTALGGATVQGVAVQALTLQGTRFFGVVDGQALSGVDFIGAVFQEPLPDGTFAELQVLDIEADPGDPSGETLLYSLWSRDPQSGAGGAACAADAAGDRRAVPLSGVWSEQGDHSDSAGRFSFGCVSGVLAKCLRWGYRPWQSVAGRSLRDYHQACTRMARADYCGDGTSATQDGTLIDVYDDIGVQVRAPQETLLFDGAWTPDGAYCISKERWVTLANLLSLSCRLRFVNLSILNLQTSPIAGDDLCLLKRGDLPRSAVRMDNRSGLNIQIGLPLLRLPLLH